MYTRRFASIKTLVKYFNITKEQAKLIRDVIRNKHVALNDGVVFLGYMRPAVKGDLIPICDTFQSVTEWTSKCFIVPPLVERQMCAINQILNTHGVEAIQEGDDQYIGRVEYGYDRTFWQSTVLLYCNRGDTYETTIAYEPRRNRFILTSWGDWYEKNMKMEDYHG